MNFASMPVVLLFVITMAANLCSLVVLSHYSHKAGDNPCNFYFYSAVCSAVSAVAVFLITGCQLQCSLFTALLGALFGLTVCLQQVSSSFAMARGPFSYTTVIISMATMISALSGVLFWDETLKALQIVGMGLMVLCLVFSVKKEKEKENKKASVTWLLLSLFSCLCNGAVGVMQKAHQSSSHRDELAAFLVIAFAVSCLFAVGMLCFLRLKNRHGTQPSRPNMVFALPVVLGLLVLSGVSTAFNHCINLYLSGVIAAAVFFPIVNGGGLMLVTLVSFFIYHERLSARQWLGLVAGVAATLCLCL